MGRGGSPARMPFVAHTYGRGIHLQLTKLPLQAQQAMDLAHGHEDCPVALEGFTHLTNPGSPPANGI